MFLFACLLLTTIYMIINRINPISDSIADMLSNNRKDIFFKLIVFNFLYNPEE